MKINLHVHTNHSLDGEFDTNELLNFLKKNNFDVVSITDHNTCSAYKDIKDDFDMKIIAGIEADAIVNNHTYDFLCYDFNLENVTEYVSKTYQSVEKRQKKIFNVLVEKCILSNINLKEIDSYNPSKEYAHEAIFRMLDKNFLEKYNLKNLNDFYRISTIDSKFPLFIDMHIVWPDIIELVQVIHQNHGKVFLAHPYRYKRNVLEVLDDVKNYVDGIEISNNNTKEEVEFLYRYAKENNLLVSCGSDYHGNNRYSIDCKYLSDQMINDVLSWIKI
jgi:predicted metal-dependent phosphoesterase TrpH